MILLKLFDMKPHLSFRIILTANKFLSWPNDVLKPINDTIDRCQRQNRKKREKNKKVNGPPLLKLTVQCSQTRN